MVEKTLMQIEKSINWNYFAFMTALSGSQYKAPALTGVVD